MIQIGKNKEKNMKKKIKKLPNNKKKYLKKVKTKQKLK